MVAIDTSLWSDKARARSKHSRRHTDIEDCADLRAMRAGPKLDGTTLIVPGGRKWYRKEAARFWHSVGFEWDPDVMQYTRDVRQLLKGKRYSAAKWLERTWVKFYEFYPELEQLDLWTV